MRTTRKKHMIKKSGFTLIEVLITVSLLAVWFAGIFAVMQNSTQLLLQTEQKALAINLTRQAIEWIQNIRDTNRIKRAGNKDACRLKVNPLVDTNNDGCENDEWIQSWRYILSWQYIGNQKYFTLDPIVPTTGDFDTIEGAEANRALAQLCKDTFSWSPCNDIQESPIIIRAVHISWLYAKDSTTPWGTALSCTDGTTTDGSILCGGPEAKELRFCATTRIIWEQNTHSTLCSSITNFAD